MSKNTTLITENNLITEDKHLNIKVRHEKLIVVTLSMSKPIFKKLNIFKYQEWVSIGSDHNLIRVRFK